MFPGMGSQETSEPPRRARSPSGWLVTHGPERGAKLLDQESRLLESGKMAAFGLLPIVDQPGIDLLGPTARHRIKLFRESGDRDRHLDAERLEEVDVVLFDAEAGRATRQRLPIEP